MASAIYYLLLSLFTVICFVPFAVLFALTVFFDKERVALHWASRVWSYGIFRLCPLWKLRVEGREKIDRSRPWVIVTNHQSMLDIPLMYVLPLNFKWVSKKEVQKMPIFGWVLWMHGDIPVERGSRRSAKRMMERCVERLSRGTSVIVFPEGTRTRTGEIGRFKDGAFLVAKSAGVGIQPVVIDGTWSLMKGWRVRMPHTFRAGARSDSARAGRFLGSPGAGRTDRSVDEGGARTDAFRREIEYFEESS
ncbi:lysophospholipid acyltransferase family protein [Alistipes ihumii]|uniref:lysophospholipid acyltransferase family protein n=1 Tax=Alistipes ihumii TaxID=1470347 RepID=UPI003078D975